MLKGDTDIRKVQKATLRHNEVSESTVISITEAIRVAGLENGGSFHFDPNSIEENGMLTAIGSKENVDGRSERYARNIRHEGEEGGTLGLVIPHELLEKLIEPKSIESEEPSEVAVWAGDRLLAFEMGKAEERTVHIDCDDIREEDRER